MKKVALSLATVLAAATFAPEASAIPSFARQTGMACSSCHFQKFPVLNAFGRSFKSAGYTMMGAQEKVEGEHLGIPAVLNGSMLLKYRYQSEPKKGGATTAGAGTTAYTAKADGQWQMGDEFALFFGGRIAENDFVKIGFLNENAAGALSGFRMPIVTEVGGIKISAVPFLTDALGAQYGFELSSSGVLRSNRWAEHRREISATQYLADRAGAMGNAVPGDNTGAASGHAFVVQNDLFFVNYTIWTSSFAPGALGGTVPSTNYGQKYIRAAVTPSFAGFDIVAGVGQESGNSASNIADAFGDGTAPGAVQMESKMTFVDFQAHGEVAGMESGFYFQNATAPVCSAGMTCLHNNGGTKDRKATTVGADITVIPHALTVGAAYRKAESGAATNNGDDAVTVTAVYDLFQNVALHANYSTYSGSAHTAATAVKSLTTFMVEAAW